MKQQRGETLTDLIQRVVNHSHSCQLRALREDMAIYVVINGVQEEKLMSELLQIFDINMDRLMTTCAKYESAERTIEELDKKADKYKVEVGAARMPQRKCTKCGSVEHVLQSGTSIIC